MSSTFGDQPGDVVTSSRGDVLEGVSLSLYPSKADAVAGTNLLTSVTTNLLGRWSYTHATLTVVWARTLDGQVYGVEDPTTVPIMDAANVTTGVLDAARVPALPYDAAGAAAAAIATAGTNADTKIATQHTTDDLAYDRKHVFNVKSFGATGDGVTDDTTSIVAAIAAAHASTGATLYVNAVVYFPDGIYLSDQINLDGLKVTLIGSGSQTTTIKANAGQTDYLIKCPQTWSAIAPNNLWRTRMGGFKLQGTCLLYTSPSPRDS